MTRIRYAVAAGAALLALVVGAAPATAATKLVGTVGPSFTITLKKGGKKVTTLKAGTYTLTVQDKSDFHNFHLMGPGVNKKTTVAQVKTVIWTIKLKKGTYRYVCDPHSSQMKGSFKVT
jgi:plastocyanin